MHGVDQVRAFAEQTLALAHRLADQVEFAVFEVAQAAVNDPGRTAGDARGKIVLLDQESALSGARTLACDSHAIDATADHNYVKVLAFQ